MCQQVASRFHNDLRGAIAAKIPIDFGQAARRVNPPVDGIASRKKLERLCDFDGEPDGMPKSYSAGLRLYEHDVPADVVLDGLSWRLMARGQIAKVVSRSVLYLLVLAFIAVVGISFQQAFAAPDIRAFHEDLKLDQEARFFNATGPANPGTDSDQLRSVATATAIAAFVSLSLMVLIGPATLARWLGGRHYESDRASWASARAAQALVQKQVNKDEAIRVAGDLVGNVPGVTTRLSEAVDSLDDPVEICNRLRSLADYFRASASDRLVVMHSLVPTTMVTLIGGAVALSYGLAVFYPLIDVLHRLSGAMQ